MSVRRHDSRAVFPRSVGPAFYYSESSAALPSFTFQFPQLITCHSAKPFASSSHLTVVSRVTALTAMPAQRVVGRAAD